MSSKKQIRQLHLPKIHLLLTKDDKNNQMTTQT